MKRISEQEAFGLFDRYWNDLTHSFFKYEGQQIYREDNYYFNEYAALRKGGSVELAIDAVTDWMVSNQLELWEAAQQRGILLQRVHMVELPISDYVEYELLTYKISEQHGERVFLITKEEAERAGVAPSLPDFFIFDNRCVTTRAYHDGEFKHAEATEKEGELESFRLARDKLLGAAQRVNWFIATHKLD